jgi:septal ring factor EnvC (AmiA/AmiB activator)
LTAAGRRAAGWLALALAAATSGVGVPVTAQAQSSQDQTLRQLEQDLAVNRQRQDLLNRQAGALTSELQELRGRLVTLTQAASRQDADLATLEAALGRLELEQRDQLDRLQRQRRQIAGLLGALLRLARTPPAALLVRPEAPVDTLRAGILLRSILPTLEERAHALARTLDRLFQTRSRLAGQRRLVLAGRSSLAASRDEIAALVTERERLSRETDAERLEVARTMARLTAQAGDLRQLLQRIEIERRATEDRLRLEALARAAAEARMIEMAPPPAAESTPTPSPPLAAAAPHPPPPPAPPSGRIPGMRLPVAGDVAVGFGAPDQSGNPSRGLHLLSRPGSPVVSPLDGTVRFAGPFRNFGQLLIVEHGNGYHSLIAGLARIDTTVGRAVSAGEPVGVSGDPAGEPSELYFEFRHNGQPVNPQRGASASDAKGHG